MMRDMRFAKTMLTDSRGATSIEYALIAGLIVLASAGSMGLAGNALGNTLHIASNQLDTAPATHTKG